jgi:bacterioferritin-associated ferredoxin
VVVCSCRAVTDRTVHAAICGGAESVDELASLCKAGSRCGGCWPELQRLLAEFSDVGKTRSEHAA